MSLRTIQALTEAGVLGSIMYRLDNPVNQFWDRIVRRTGSMDPRSQTHGWLGGAPELSEQTGKPQSKKPRANTYTILNKAWQAGIQIPAHDWDAAQKDPQGLAANIDAKVQEGIDKALMHPGTRIQELITAGETTVCYDGQNYFDTDHSEGDSGTQDNDLTRAIAAAATPTADEMVDSILKCVQAIMGFKDDEGTEINMNTKDFLVCAPLAYMSPMLKALNAELIGSGNTNIMQGSRSGINFTGQLIPRVTGNKVYVFAQRQSLMGSAFIWQVFNDVAPEVLGRTSEHCKLNDELLFLVKARYNLGYGRWQDACLMTHTTA